MTELENLIEQRDGAKEAIKIRIAIERLEQNRDYKLVIRDLFMRDECAKYAQLSSDPNMDANSRADALGIAQAAGHLKRFIAVMKRMADHHESQLPNVEAAIEELRLEEAQGDAESEDA